MRRSPWATLTVLALAQFIVVLDVTIVNVALPHIQTDLGFTPDGLQWVISAYTLVFGGFLLLGGRAADLLGARRVFVAGLVLFGLTSLAGGLATSPGLLIAARTVQGLGGALLSPAALGILTMTFPHGRQRNIAMGVWGGLAGLGGTAGVVAGGFLVDSISWRWVFNVNVPIVVLLVVLTPLLVRATPAPKARQSFDLLGALLATGGLLAVVYSVVRAEPLGWTSAEVIGFLAGGIALLAAFVAVETRSAAPLVPMRLLRSRALSSSGGAISLNGAAFLSMFFLTALFLQQVRGDTALRAGVHFLPMGGAAIASAVLVTPLVTRFGTRPVQIAGTLFSAVGLLLLSRADATGAYAAQIMPGTVLFGIGIIAVSVPSQIAAVVDARESDAGAASGVFTAFQQVGGAIGLAVVTTVANSRAAHVLAAGGSASDALVAGFHRGLLLSAAFCAGMFLVSLASPRIAPGADRVVDASEAGKAGAADGAAEVAEAAGTARAV